MGEHHDRPGSFGEHLAGRNTFASRRTFLAAVATGALAGCLGGPSAEADTDTGTGTPGTTDAETTDAETTDAETTDAETTDGAASEDDLDLREANVTGVEVEETDGKYRFDVTLYHDDDGEDGYADWWQVETVDGERLGRRDLAHAHGTTPFTRSTTVVAHDDVACVVVRGHDQTHEYGGQAALVDPKTGATHLVRQGSDPDSFDEADCPSE